MRRGPIISILALTIAGCGDSSTEILPPQSAATLQDESGEVTVEVFERDYEGADILRTISEPAGTRVTVLEDAAAKPPVVPHLRLVQVRIEEGKDKGVIGGVNRQELRAMR